MDCWAYLVTVALLPCVFAVSDVEDMKASDVQNGFNLSSSDDNIFEDFKSAYNKQYGSTGEEKRRKDIFKANLEYIKEHNEMYSKGQTSFYLGINWFADMTHQEFVKTYADCFSKLSPINGTEFVPKPNVNLPNEVDWRKKGYVTPVKDQGRCGSCYSFSATGTLEGQHYKKTKRLISLSEQQIVDCSQSFGNNGCNGGFPVKSLEYIQKVGGIETEGDYRYAGRVQRCQFAKSKVQATVSGHVSIKRGSEAALQQAVASVGPVSIAIDASHKSFQLYRGGVYNEPACSTTKPNHAVLAVGYGTSSSEYWLVKNSWTKNWGNGGYINMSRNKNNQCGVASFAVFPRV